MAVIIKPEHPESAAAAALITRLEAELDPLYPPASQHGLSVAQLVALRVAFFVLRDNDIPAGCCGIQLFGNAYGELKRFYVCPEFRGLGYGTKLIGHLADYVRSRGVSLLRLETGIHQTAAIRLCERMNFYQIPPFGDYTEDPLSLFYEKRLA